MSTMLPHWHWDKLTRLFERRPMRKPEETRLINNDRARMPALVKTREIGFIRVQCVMLSHLNLFKMDMEDVEASASSIVQRRLSASFITPPQAISSANSHLQKHLCPSICCTDTADLVTSCNLHRNFRAPYPIHTHAEHCTCGRQPT